MPRSINREKLQKKAEAIAKEAFFEPADLRPSSRVKQQQRWSALRTLVGDEAAAKESPLLKDQGDNTPAPPPKPDEVSSGKGKFQARGGRVRKAMGGRVKKTYFSCY